MRSHHPLLNHVAGMHEAADGACKHRERALPKRPFHESVIPIKPMTYLHHSGGRAALLSAAASLSVLTALPAAVKTWDGAGVDDNWQSGQNWNADTAPATDDQLVFAGTARPSPMNNYPAGTPFNGITANAGAATFTLSGNALTLTRGIMAGGLGAVSGGTITNSSANPLNLQLPVTLASGKFTINSPIGGGGINFSGAFTRSANASVVFIRAGTGQINFTGSGLVNDASGIIGGWATFGNDWATLNGSGQVTAYNAYTPIATGALPLNGANVNYLFTNDTGNITAATGTTLNTLSASIGANRNLNITGQMRLGTKGGIHRQGSSNANSILTVAGGTITAEGGGEITLWDATTSAGNFAGTNNNLRVDSVMTNDGTSPVSVNIVGYLDIRGANTYSGGTFINQGRVQAGNVGVFGTGPVTVYQGGQAFLNSGSGSFPNGFIVTGNGTTENNGGVDGAGAIRLGTTATISGPVTYSGFTRLTSNSTGAGGTISGRISGSGPLQVGGFATSGAIMNLSNVGTPNDWTGPLSISALSASRVFTLRLGASNQIPDNTDVTVNGGTTCTWELNAFNEVIGTLNSPLNAGAFIVSNTTAGTSTLTFGGNNANGDFGGTLRDNATTSTLNLVKDGTGKQILRGAIETIGTTTINGGTLESLAPLYNSVGDLTVNSGATFAVTGIVYCANVTVAGGTLRPTHADAFPLDLDGNLNLGTGSTLDLNTAVFAIDAPIIVRDALNTTGAAGSVVVNINGAEPAVGQHKLVKYGSLTGTGASAFVLGQAPPRMVANIIDDPGTTSVVLNVTASGVSAVWTGAVSSEWSTANLAEPKNWVLSSNPLTTTDFLTNDSVIFNDSAANNSVELNVADVSASSVTFDNTDDAYQLSGSKGITGLGSLIKNGTNTVTIANLNSYSGGTTINAGTVQVNTGGSLGSGAVTNEGTLTLNRNDNSTFPNAIGGAGDVHHNGTGSTTVNGANTYTGDTVISAGTVRVINGGAFGDVGGAPVQVLAGGAVDIAGNPTANNQNFGAKQFLISGNGPAGTGALVNSGTVNQLNAYQEVALEADASVGGTGRFDIRGGTPTLDLNGHTLRKRGSNQFTLVGVGVEDGGTIIVEQGLFAMETTSVTHGNGSVICEPGTYAGFYQNVTGLDVENNVIGVSWPYTLREGVVMGNAGTQLATILSPVILEGNASLNGFNASAPDPAQVRPLTLTGNITENGGSYSLAKNGISVITLTGTASTYTGATLVNDGTLVVNGNITASPVTVEADAILGGTGTLGGSLTTGGIINPGMAVIGTFTTGAATFNGTATLGMQINSTALTSDKLVVNGSLTLGGVLGLNDLTPVALAAGSKLTLVTYSGSLSGAFANVADGGTLLVGPNTFRVDYDEDIGGGLKAVTLTIPTGTPYDLWASDKGLDGTNNGKLADPDKDGLENILEFALDGAPLAAARDGKTRVAVADVDPGAPVDVALTLTLPVRNGAVFTGPGDLVSANVDNLVYSIQGSVTMSEFLSLNVTEVTPALSAGMPALSTGWTYRSFRVPGNPKVPDSKGFLRVNVESP